MNNIHSPSAYALVKPSLTPAVRTAAANGKAVDTQAAGVSVHESALVIFHLGAHDHTTGDEIATFSVDESADGSTGWVAVAGASWLITGAVVPDATSGNEYMIELDLTKRLRYLRAVHTPAGTTPSDAIAASIVLFNGSNKPETQDATVVRV